MPVSTSIFGYGSPRYSMNVSTATRQENKEPSRTPRQRGSLPRCLTIKDTGVPRFVPTRTKLSRLVAVKMKWEDSEHMARASLAQSALVEVPNRFELCHLASRATRAFHVPSTTVAHTINFAFFRIGGSHATHPEIRLRSLAHTPIVDLRRAISSSKRF